MARIYTTEDFEHIAHLKDELYTVDFDGYEPIEAPFDAILKQNKRRIPQRIMRALMGPIESGVDRSSLMFSIGATLLEAGISFDHAYILLQGSPINKFDGRSDEVQRIYETLVRARDKPKDNVRELRLVDAKKNGKLPWQEDEEFKAAHFSPPRWQVESMWVEASKGFIAAEPKSGKSTLVLDMAVSVATGTPFLGEFEVHKPGRVFVIQEEMDSGEVQWRRQKILGFKELDEHRDFATVNDDGSITLDYGATTNIAWLNESGFKLDDDDHREELEKKVRRERPVMIFFDPLQRLLRTSDIRSERDMNEVFEWLDHIRRTYRTSIVLVHHLRKPSDNMDHDDQMRMLGSQALASWYETLLMVTRKDASFKIKPTFRSKQRLPVEVTIDWGDDEDPVYVPTVKGKGLLRPTKQTMLEMVTENPGLTYSQLMKALNISERQVRRKAKDLGLRQRRRKTKGGGAPVIELHPPKR